MTSNEARAALYATLPLCVAMIAAAIFVSVGSGSETPDEDAYAQVRLLTDTLDLIDREYVEEVDRWDAVYDALGAMARLDPYSNFYDPEQAKRFDEQTHRQYFGVGFAIHPTLPRLTIEYVFRDSPALEAGIVAGDRIVAVDGTPIEQLDQNRATERIKGPLGTSVTLSVERASGSGVDDLSLRRARITQPTVFTDHYNDPEGRIGYVRLSAFGERTDVELDRALIAMNANSLDGLVLDLRFNQGGLVDPCRTVANRFLKEGLIVGIRHRDADESRSYPADPEKCLYPDLPLVVLINGDSASAAEIVAGALQDHGRALLVGERSYGKGVVQSIYPLTIGDEEQSKVVVKLTTGEYLTPSGRIIEKAVRRKVPVRGGLPPDVHVMLSDPARKTLIDRFTLLEVPAASREFYLDSHGIEIPTVDDRQLNAALAVLRGEVVAQDLPRNDTR